MYGFSEGKASETLFKSDIPLSSLVVFVIYFKTLSIIIVID
jgi:hypothetical protein